MTEQRQSELNRSYLYSRPSEEKLRKLNELGEVFATALHEIRLLGVNAEVVKAIPDSSLRSNNFTLLLERAQKGCLHLAEYLEDSLVPGRLKSLAMTQMELTKMYLSAALARDAGRRTPPVPDEVFVEGVYRAFTETMLWANAAIAQAPELDAGTTPA